MTTKTSKEEVLAIIQQIISELTGNEIEDIDPAAHLDEELGITAVDLARILKRINSEFGTGISSDDLEEEEIETVGSLVSYVHEEAELG